VKLEGSDCSAPDEAKTPDTIGDFRGSIYVNCRDNQAALTHSCATQMAVALSLQIVRSEFTGIAKAAWNILAEIRADLAINYRGVHRRDKS
jgi:hypothetical protein